MSGVAFVFAGQGSQYVGMGKDLLDANPEIRRNFDQAEEALDKSFLDLCLYGPEDELNNTINTQPCLYILSYSIYKIIEGLGYRPQVVAGHSLGEYTALTSVGTFNFIEGLRIVAKRAELMSREAKRNPGRMLAVLGADVRSVDTVVAELSQQGIISVANYNCPGQVVVSVESSLSDEAIAALSKAGAKKVMALPVSGAFHSAMMREAETEFNAFLDSFIFMSASIPLIPNTLVRPVVEATDIKNALRTQMSSPVKWQQSIEQIIGSGIRVFVEIGPGQILSKIIKRIDSKVEVLSTDTPDSLMRTVERLKEV
ncbi:MAG TPA: ACP S-malonyltransferase [Anaerolineae bacterium]|jgi:[acyl-carrier-protein] S-malonyltransferase|nr:ACP S-malonyltransferase [Anaerolineae bacterium]